MSAVRKGSFTSLPPSRRSVPDHNILLDLRGTKVVSDKFGDVMETAQEIVNHLSGFRGKVANVIPKDKQRMARARQLQTCLELEGLQYEIFTEFEKAIEWLSEVTEIERQ